MLNQSIHTETRGEGTEEGVKPEEVRPEEGEQKRGETGGETEEGEGRDK